MDAPAGKRKAPVSVAAVEKCPGLPNGKKKPPMMVGPCVVYTDCTKKAWRARVPGNRKLRSDKAFSWKTDSAKMVWERLVTWCYAQKA
eukprot:4514721-Pyramimonas_sp.AAC.1